MFRFTTGNIIKSTTDAIVNTVNTYGIMGKGIALSYKEAFPLNFRIYEKACKDGTIDIGRLLITETGGLYPRYIINFPTKKHWRYPSKYEYIEAGLKNLIEIIEQYNIKSISIPPLGSGNGRLEWEKVKCMILNILSHISEEVEIVIYEPGFNDQRLSVANEIDLTEPRVLYLYVLYSYHKMDNQLNLLIAQKIAYFLSLYKLLPNLKFEKWKYGPYSYNLIHLLKKLNNAFVEFDERQNSPTTEIKLINNKYNEIDEYYKNKVSIEVKNKIEKFLNFIEGFESTYGLELLSTIHFIVENTKKRTTTEIQHEISHWTERKKEIMKPYHIEVALERLIEYNLI